METEELYHIGIKRRSGRYPYGSGKNPMQHENTGRVYVHGTLDDIGDSPIPFIVMAGSVVAVAAVNKVLNKVKFSRLLKMAPVLEMASDNKEKFMSRFTEEADRIALDTGLKLKEKETSAYEDLQAVSKGFNYQDENLRDNCVKATIAYYLRRIGLDAVPETMGIFKDDQNGINLETLDRLLPGLTKAVYKENISGKDPKDLLSKIIMSKTNDDNAFGGISLSYIDKYGNVDYHLMAWERADDKIIISDPQSGDDKKVIRIFNRIKDGIVSPNVDIYRFDTLSIDTSELPMYVKNRDE